MKHCFSTIPIDLRVHIARSIADLVDSRAQIASIVDIVESEIATRTAKEEYHQEKQCSPRVTQEANCDEAKELRAKLEEKSLEIERLSRRLSCVEKVCRS